MATFSVELLFELLLPLGFLGTTGCCDSAMIEFGVWISSSVASVIEAGSNDDMESNWKQTNVSRGVERNKTPYCGI